MIGVRIQHGPEVRACPGLHRETWLVAVDVSSEGSDSDGLNAWSGFATRTGESDEPTFMIGTSILVESPET